MGRGAWPHHTAWGGKDKRKASTIGLQQSIVILRCTRISNVAKYFFRLCASLQQTLNFKLPKPELTICMGAQGSAPGPRQKWFVYASHLTRQVICVFWCGLGGFRLANSRDPGPVLAGNLSGLGGIVWRACRGDIFSRIGDCTSSNLYRV